MRDGIISAWTVGLVVPVGSHLSKDIRRYFVQTNVNRIFVMRSSKLNGYQENGK